MKGSPVARWAFILIVVQATAGGAAGAAERPFAVVDTGQERCYGAGEDGELATCPKPGSRYYGQDAQYSTRQPAYADNGDGTVTDLVTGLMWQKAFARDVQWSDAGAAARAARTGGYQDWRVPTIKELYSLIDFSGTTGTGRPDAAAAPSDARPFIDSAVFDFEYPSTGGSGVGHRYIDAQYISSTAYAGRTMERNATFFGVNFADGRIKGYPQAGRPDGTGWYLRLVRGNERYGINAFSDNGDGTVGDAATGLTWMRADSADASHAGSRAATHYGDGRMDWPEALAFCEALDLGGHDDWRLPDAKELQGILDYDRSPQKTKTAAIASVFAASPIEDEAGHRNYGAYWTSTTHLDSPVPGSDAVVVSFGEALGGLKLTRSGPQPSQDASDVMDVHGAGAQRSDPKTGDPDDYPVLGFGPQGDVRRVYNLVRCVRGG